MRLFGWQWLAASSLMLATLAGAETRPQYGGTLHVAVQEAPASLDPADRSVPDSVARRGITWLLFDTLVTTDEAGHPRPLLADSWQTVRGSSRWEFRIRRNVRFHDGTPLTAEIVASSLRFANPSWSVSAEGEAVLIERQNSVGAVFAELALPRNAIVKRDTDNALSGTGPFRVLTWRPGAKLVLAADENCWRGRPFLDGLEIDLGKSYRDQLAALQMGSADLIEVAPEQAQHLPQQGRTMLTSPALELVALSFAKDPASPEEKTLREALGLSIDRGSTRDVLLRGAGHLTGSILPTWLSGYGFVFSSSSDLARARQLRQQVHSAPTWKLGYNTLDPTDRLLAERIALNAKDAGLTVQPIAGGTADIRLMRIPMSSSDAWLAFSGAVAEAGIHWSEENGVTVEELYRAEVAILSGARLIPLLDLPVSYASSTSVKNWHLRSDGSWDLGDTWIDPNKR